LALMYFNKMSGW